jgi:acetolactate synthase I/II/III large subunit
MNRMDVTAPEGAHSAGRLLVAQLERQGVERVYCVPGESYLDVLDALYDSKIATVVCRQEGGAGFMAVADGRVTGGVGVAMVTRGPGAANAMISVHTAWQDASPLVLFVGLVPLADRGRESFQEIDPAAWFGSTAKRVLTLDVPERAAEVVAEAFHLAASGRPGPVVVGLPEDVLVGRTTQAVVPPRELAAGAVSGDQADHLCHLLAEAERPLMIVGGDRWDPRSAERFTRWCERWSLPVATDFRAHDIVDHDSPSFVGWLGLSRDPALSAVLDEADLLVFVGCGAADILTEGYRRGRQAARVVVVDPDPGLRTHQHRVDLHLLATPGALMEEVAERAPAAEPVWTGWSAEAREAQQRFGSPAPDGPGTGVDLGVAMRELRARLAPDAIVTYGAGNHAVWPQRYLPHHSYPSLLAPRNGAMGFGVPAAVAAAIAHPGRQVVSVAGDGCFLMNGQELATAAANDVAPLILVVDNAQYGTIVAHQERHYPGRPSASALVNPDFAGYARAFGGFGERVSRTDDFAPALDRALGSGRLALLHLLADPGVLRPQPSGG